MAVQMHIYSAATFFLKFELLRNSFCAFTADVSTEGANQKIAVLGIF
jgi:hypothetical protein